MTKLLISVTDVDEALTALRNGADIIDLKDPALGALGALSLSMIEQIVSEIRNSEFHDKWISATIGDLPMIPELIGQRVKLLGETGVDFVKIGFFNDPASAVKHNHQCHAACLTELKKLSAQSVRLIAVLFAESAYAPELIDDIQDAGFYGLMVDTAVKNGATLFDHLTLPELAELRQELEQRGLAFGMAGSLRVQHLELAKQYQPNFIGFRAGVCRLNQRVGRVDPQILATIRQIL